MIARVKNKVFKQGNKNYYAYIEFVSETPFYPEGHPLWACTHSHDDEEGADICGEFEMMTFLSPEEEYEELGD